MSFFSSCNKIVTERKKKIKCSIYANGFNEFQYINDQNELSGWYNFYTYNNNSFIMASAPYDGFIAGATTATGSKDIECLINDTQIAFMTNGGAGTARFGEIAFKKGDKVVIAGNSYTSYCFVCFYEKRDYSNR